ncbi:hypothetical protein [Cetobacterium sp.]|uniref:hypothetical protein n=1 Tax=Cetobacterium sp. TaxID=2071632 RepID=UPI002FC6558E
MNLIEFFGIIASVVIFISLAMTSIIKLRWVNTLGCLLFAIYGIMIHSIATTFLNLGIAVLNLYYLKKLYLTKEDFKLVLADKESEYFKFFLHQNYNDLEYFFSKISFDDMDKIYYLIRNNSTVGIIGWNENHKEITIQVDYVIDKFRDFKFGKYLFIHNISFFKNLGYNKIIQIAPTKAHQDYVEKIGFKKVSENIYSKDI